MAGGKMKPMKKCDRKQAVRYLPYVRARKAEGLLVTYLRNREVAADIVGMSGIKPTDVVLEIGAGCGHVTEKLLQVAKYVIVFETNPCMVTKLINRFQGHLHHRLKVDGTNFLPCTDGSCVVRYEPRTSTELPVSLREVSVLTNLLFKRKNKTLASIFQQKEGLFLLQKYYSKTSQQQQQQAAVQQSDDVYLCDNFKEMVLGSDHVANELDKQSDDDDDFKKMVWGLLKQGKLADKKAVMLTKEDFLNLVSLFYNAGIHFK